MKNIFQKSNSENLGANTCLDLTNMKKTFALPLLLAALAALFALSTPASANGSLYWLGSNGTLWTAGENWSSTSNGTSPVNFSADSSIVFSTSNNSSATDLGGNQSISSLTINATGPVGISGGNLTINGTTAQAITVEAGNLTISSPLILTGSATAITANQSTSIASITSANGLVFNGTSSASIGAITANGSLQKLGSGVTTLTANNTYTGNTTISDGTLALSANGTLGNSTVIISGGTLDMGGKSLTNTLGTLAGGEIANGTLTNNGSSFNLQNGTISANLAGTNGVNKTTSGTVILSGSNTYNGTTSINAGTLQIGNASGFGSGGNITFGGGILQYGSGITADVSSRIKNSASAIRIDTNGNNVTFSSSINSTNNGGLTKLGNGTLSLSANSSYTGGTFIETGTLTGSTQGLKGNITNNATLLLNSFSGSYKTEISGTGKLLIGNPPFSTPVRFLGNATMTGGTTILQGGILTIGGLDSNTYIVGSISGDIANEGRLEFDLSTAAGSRTYAGIISGNGSLGTSNAGSGATGRLILTGNNTYTGGTFVSLGTVDISGGRLASTGNVTITGGNFEIGASNQVIGDFQISGTQITSATGTGTLTATLYDLQQGTVSISLAGTAGIEKNSVGAGASSYDNGIAFLSGNNTSNGTISVSSGILSFNTVQSLYSGNNSSWTKENISVGAGSTTPFIATLALATGNGSATSGFNNEQIAEIFSNLTQNGTGGLTANSSIGFNVASGNFTLNSTISDRPDGGAIGMEKIGAGVLVLGTQNSFSGPLNIYEGTVRAGTNNALSNSTSLVITTKMGERPSIYDVGNFNQQFVNVTLLSGTLAGGTGTINATGNYTLWSGNATANLSGEAGLTKEGSENEIVYLSGNNSYTGHTTTNGTYWNGYVVDAPTVSDARLQFQKPAALYSGNNATWNTGNITVNSYGILSVQAGDGVQGFTSNQIGTLITNLVTADRTTGGFLNGSALGIDTAGVNITLETPLTDSGITGGGSVGLVKYGTGTLTLNGNNTHSLVTSVTGGGLVVANGAQLSASTAGLSIQNATVDLGTNSQSVGSVYVSNGSILGSGTLTSTAGQFYFVGANVTPNLAGSVNATITSPGTTTLSGNNSYSGRTYLSASATLILANANALAGSTLSTYSNGSPVQLSAPGTNTYNFGGLEGSLNLNFGANSLSIGANNENTSFGSSTGILSGSGTVTKVGNGTLTLLGNNTYSGGTTISAGTLALGNGGTSGSVTGDITNNANLVFNRSGNSTYSDTISGTGNFTKAGSGILNLNGTQTYTGTTTISGGTLGLVGSLASTSVAISSGATLLNQNSGLSADSSIVNAGTFTINASETVGSLSGSGNTVLNAALTTGDLGTADEISGNITGNASLTKTGTGNLTLTGSATNSGGLVISNGTVSIGNGGTTGSVTGNITNNAALAFNRSNNSTYSGIISGTGTLEKLGNGTLTLTGNNSANGAITITTGTLQLGNGGTSGSVAGDITNNGALAINRSDDLTFSNTMSGTGSVVKLGNNTLTYNSTVTPTGGTFVNAGTLVVSGTTSAVTINANGTLAGNGTVGNVVINSGGTIAPGNSPGTITTGNMTWNGGGIYNWQLGNANGTAGTDWDLISSNGSLTMVGSNFTIAASTTNASGFDPSEKFKSWTIANFAGGITGFSAEAFTINATGFENLPAAYLFGVSSNGTALSFTYSTIATWVAGTGNWTNSGNWDQGFIPIDGVAVEYAGTNGTSTNDSTIGEIYSLTFTEANAGAFTLAGGNLTIGEGGIVNNSNSTQTIALNLALGANQTFAANTANLVVSGNISGNASVTKAGNQTLTLTGSNTYNGGTIINSGTLLLESTGQISHSGTRFEVGGEGENAAVILNAGSISNFAGYIGFGNGSTGTVNMNSGNWTNGENLRVGYYGNGTLNLTGGSISNVNGVIGRYGAGNGVANVSGGSWSSSGNLRIGDEATGTLNLTGGNVVVASGSGNVTIGSTAGSTGTLNIGTGTNIGTLQAARVTGGSGTAIVNFNHTVTDHIFSPILAGNLTVNKLGNGTTALTGNNSYTQGTVITAGTLAAQSTSALGTGHVDLNNTGVLAIGSFASGLANMALSVGGNLSWSSNSSTIALLNGASANITGSLSSNGVVGNRTFDVSQYGVVSNNTITLAYLGNNATDILTSGNSTANATFDISFTSLSQSSTVLTTGNFVIDGNLLKYVISSATANGSSLDIRNSDADFVVDSPTTAGTTVVTGQNPLVKDVIFQGSNNLVVPTGVALTVFGQEGTAAGQLDVQNGTSSIVSGSGTIEAPNGLDKIGGGELDLQSNTNVTGIATVVEGLLSVNGQLATTGGVVVDPGATLGGAGFIIGNVVVNGNLSPGNSPGTLTIAGDLNMTSATVTTIEIASPTNFDRIVVSGQATVDGTLNAVAYGGGTITPGTRYDFLQAGSITGEFDSIVAPEGLRARFLNSGTIGTLLFGPGSYVMMAINQNQRNVAKALDSFILATSGDQQTVSLALDSLTTEQFPAAFDQIMPGFYESLGDILIEQTYNQTQLLTQRLGTVRVGAQGFQAIGLSQPIKYDKDGTSAADAKTASPIVESAIETNWNAWVMANGEFSISRGLAGVPNYNNNAGGFLVGADYRLSENFAAGLFAGYEYSYAKYDGGSSTRGNSALFGLYGSYTHEDGYYADAIVSGGYTGFQTRRSIEFGTIDRTASADPNSGQFSAALNLGKDFDIGKFTLGPIIGAQYTYAGIGGFTETGAESLDLALGQQNANSLRTNLGARLAYNWEVASNITLIPEVRAFWMHEFLNNPRNISSTLDGGNGPSFDYETTAPYRDSVFGGAGISAKIGDRWSGSVFYNVNFGAEGYTNNIISTSLGFSF